MSTLLGCHLSNWSINSTQSQLKSQQAHLKKFIWKSEESRLIKIVLKNNKIGDLVLTNFKANYKSRQHGIGIKVDRCVKWDLKESLEIDPHNYGQLIFHRGAKTFQWKRDNF